MGFLWIAIKIGICGASSGKSVGPGGSGALLLETSGYLLTETDFFLLME